MGEDLKLKFIEDLGTHNVAKSGKKNMRRLWLVECPYCKRHFKIRATQIDEYKSCGCRVHNKETKDSLVSKLNTKFPEHKLDLVNLVFKEGQHSLMNVICKEHGAFEITANRMLNLKCSPCPKCSADILGKMYIGDTEGFITKAVAKYGDKYKYDKVKIKVLSEDVEIYCVEHQAYFKINANNFLYNVKVGCPLCIKDKKDEKVRARQGAFIDKCVKVHGDNYDLSLIKYIGTNFPIEVVCPEHGSWFPIAYNFERGSGCPICAELKKECRYTDNPTLFYIFKINELYKVGITSKTLEGRYLGKDLTKEEFQNIELVFEYVFETGKPAFRLEQRLRHLFRDNLYKGDSPFKTTGISEVFTICPDLDVAKSELSRILNETK